MLDQDVLIVDVFNDEVVVVLVIYSVDDGFDRRVALNENACVVFQQIPRICTRIYLVPATARGIPEILCVW